jgi:two-component system, NtrC family, nitrogen regulation response regulator GlnG
VQKGKILVVDDDAAIRTVLGEALRREGHEVALAASAAEQALRLRDFAPDVMVTDVILPDADGLDMVPSIIEAHPGLPIIVISAQNTLSTAVRATEKGAFEYFPKPFDLNELCHAVKEALKRRSSAASNEADLDDDSGLPLVGRSAAMQDVYRTIARVVSNDLGVLILGESGTGKELVAKAIHDLGGRKAGPFIPVNMAAIPRELIEAELFGHERGAFTGASARVAGRFEQAAKGTLFLDEIGDMPMDAQTRLLRVLQSGEFTTVGGNRPIKANVRIIAATNKNLMERVEAGSFREDLYYRLNVIPISLPPLRQRQEDVALLARYFLGKAAAEGLPQKSLSASAIDHLIAHDWPGNVRELENLMRRLAILARDDVIGGDLILQFLSQSGAGDARPASSGSGPMALEASVTQHVSEYFSSFGSDLPPDGLYHRFAAIMERPLLLETMQRCNGNQIKAAKLLGLNRNTIRKKLSDHGIDAAHGRKRVA